MDNYYLKKTKSNTYNNHSKKKIKHKRCTSHDVAKAAGVSQSLVSLVLNDVPGKQIKPETRKRILEVAHDMNYTINVNAKNVRKNKSSAIGILSTWSASSFVYPPIIETVQNACADNSMALVVCTGRKDENGTKDFIKYFNENRIDGLIFISYVGIDDKGIIKELKDHDVPFVCIIGARDLISVSCVDVNFLKSGYIAGKHLIDQGYKNILCFAYQDESKRNYASSERIDGLNMSLNESGLTLDICADLIDSSENDQIKCLMNIIKTKQYDAFVGLTYQCSLALKCANKLGVKVPDDLGIISIDNEDYAPYLDPSLTTIDEPFSEMANVAMNILKSKLNGEDITRKIELDPKLSFRESTARNN